MLHRLVTCFTLLLAATTQAAIYEQPIAFEDEDDLYDMQERGDISTQTLETLLELLEEGVDLNEANRDELYELPGLTMQDADAVIAFRTAKGRIESPTQLVIERVLTADQLLEILPFLLGDDEPAASESKSPVGGKLRLVSAVATTDNIPPPALLAGRLAGPWGLSGGLTVATSRRRINSPQYIPAVDTLVSEAPRYQVNLPEAYGQWRIGSLRIIAGTFTTGFGERLTLDNSRRVRPRGTVLSNWFQRPTDLSRTCSLSSSEPISGACTPFDDGDAQLACSGKVEGSSCSVGGAGSSRPGICRGSPGQCVPTNLYVTPDYAWREPFRGLAVSLSEHPVGSTARISAHGFLSYQTKSIYQYKIFDRRYCADPRDESEDCSAPRVFLNEGAATGRTRFIYSTLPSLYDEVVGGGHLQVRWGDLGWVGVTGYGASPRFRSAPMQLDFQETAGVPNGGTYGAIGISGEIPKLGPVNLSFEVTRTLDGSIGGRGGGYGAIQRTTLDLSGHEAELLLRYYDNGFINPHARPVSAPDQLEGLRARNELGARLQYRGKSGPWDLRGGFDFWVLPFTNPRLGPAGMANFYAHARADLVAWKFFQPGVWVEARNRNLASSEHGKCSSGTIVYTEGEPFACNGDSYRIAAQIRSWPVGRLLKLRIGSAMDLKDDAKYGKVFFDADDDEVRPSAAQVDLYNQQGTLPAGVSSVNRATDRFMLRLTSWAELRSQPVPWLQLRLRGRYRHWDIFGGPLGDGRRFLDTSNREVKPTEAETNAFRSNRVLPNGAVRTEVDTYLERSVRTDIEVAWLPLPGTRLAVRYDLYAWVDHVNSTLTRVPNPEHRFAIDLRTAF